jgi:hypothetical protein
MTIERGKGKIGKQDRMYLTGGRKNGRTKSKDR